MSEPVIQNIEVTLEPAGCVYDRLKLLRDKVLEAGQSMMVAGGPCERCKSLNYEQEFGECFMLSEPAHDLNPNRE